MNKLKYFFDCYFHQNESFDYLDKLIQDFKEEPYSSQLEFIKELHYILDTKNYVLASKIIKKYGYRELDDLEEVEKFINYLYDKLIDRPTEVKAKDFEKDCKVVLCPVCSPKLKVGKIFYLIDKATVIKNDLQIYICKHCKVVWFTEDIRADNAQYYKKFMKTLGLKGLWKELKDVDVL